MKCKSPESENEARPRPSGRGAAPQFCTKACQLSFARRWTKLKHKYGITVDQYDQLLAEQGGGCAICGVAGPEAARWGVLVVDHDHETGKVRGLLCSNCNCAIGLLGDSPELLTKAAGYLSAELPLKEGIRG